MQVSGNSGTYERLELSYASAYSRNNNRIFEIFRDSQGGMYLKFRIYDGEKYVEPLVRAEQSGKSLEASATEPALAPGDPLTFVRRFDFETEKQLIVTEKQPCCKVSLGHVGCLIGGTCEDVYTFTRQ